MIVTCSGDECKIVNSIKKIRRITTPGIINLVAPHLAAIDMKPPCQQETIKLLFKLGYNDALDGFNEYIESKKEHLTA